MTGLEELLHLNLSRSRLGDAGLVSVGSLKRLASLILSGCAITSEGYVRVVERVVCIVLQRWFTDV